MKKSDLERRTDASTCKMLPEDYSPGAYDIWIGRGRCCTMHWGNQRFRAMIAAELPGYTAAQDCKRQKSNIIARVLADIHHHSPNAGFVKKDVATGRWLSLTDAASRVAIAQAFRDALVDTYRSSKHSKQVKRRVEKRSGKVPHLSRQVTSDHPEAAVAETEEDMFLRYTRHDWDDDSVFEDSLTRVASTVADVFSEKGQSESFQTERFFDDDFDALFQAFALEEVDTEDNPFEPVPIFDVEPLPLSSIASLPMPLPLWQVPSVPETRQEFKHVKSGFTSSSTPFGNFVPFRHGPAAMTA